MIATMTATRERIGVWDILLAVAATVGAVAYMASEVHDPRLQASWAAVIAAIAFALPLLWRRVAPLGALVAVLVALVAHRALFGELILCGLLFPIELVLVFSAGARLERRESRLALAAALAIAVIVCVSDTKYGAPPAALTFVLPLIAVVWGVGLLVRSSAGMAAKLTARNRELREARDERARLEVATERARLSSELESLLQRRLGELASLAEARAPESLVEIESKSRATLDEMRAIVGVLRREDAPLSPQPTLTQLEALLVRARGGRLVVEGAPRVLPAVVELSAYRVVEQLLDGLGEGVEVRVRFADDALELDVSGAVRRRGGEEAISRARERVQLHAGTLRATFDGGRASTVVSLPILAAV